MSAPTFHSDFKASARTSLMQRVNVNCVPERVGFFPGVR